MLGHTPYEKEEEGKENKGKSEIKEEGEGKRVTLYNPRSPSLLCIDEKASARPLYWCPPTFACACMRT